VLTKTANLAGISFSAFTSFPHNVRASQPRGTTMDLRTLVLALFAFCTTFAGGWWFGFGPKTFAAFTERPPAAAAAPAASAVQQPAQQQPAGARIVVPVPSMAAAEPTRRVAEPAPAAARKSSRRWRLRSGRR
jgi:hypothetical protein